jgi:hypothetical protein
MENSAATPVAYLNLDLTEVKDEQKKIPISNVVGRPEYWRSKSKEGNSQKEAVVAEAEFTSEVAKKLIEEVNKVGEASRADTPGAKNASADSFVSDLALDATLKITEKAKGMKGMVFVEEVNKKCGIDTHLFNENKLSEGAKLNPNLSMAQLVVVRRVLGSAYDNGRSERGLEGQSMVLSANEYKTQFGIIVNIASSVAAELKGESSYDSTQAVTIKAAPKTS